MCGNRLTNHSKIDPDYLDVVEEKYRDFGGYFQLWNVLTPYGEAFLDMSVIASGDLGAQHLAVEQSWPLGSRNPDGSLIQLHISEEWPEDSPGNINDQIYLRPDSGTLEIIALEEYFTAFRFDFVTSDGEAVSGTFSIDFGRQ